jgi:hypothetical protein
LPKDDIFIKEGFSTHCSMAVGGKGPVC